MISLSTPRPPNPQPRRPSATPTKGPDRPELYTYRCRARSSYCGCPDAVAESTYLSHSIQSVRHVRRASTSQVPVQNPYLSLFPLVGPEWVEHSSVELFLNIFRLGQKSRALYAISSDTMHPCLKCDKVFQTERSLWWHVGKHGPRRPTDRGGLGCTSTLKPHQEKYCSGKCQHAFQYDEYIRNWKAGTASGAKSDGASNQVRHYLFEKYQNKCCLCSWSEINPVTGSIPLEVDHINGNWKDNREENLRLVCPNCHSLSPTFRALNKGHGRHKEFREQGRTVYTKPSKRI